MLKPHVIGDSLVFALGDSLVQVGPVSVKELSARNIDVPPVIIFRPGDHLTIEFNFFHMFFFRKKPLVIYALPDQVEALKKVMQISLFGGERGWAGCTLEKAIDSMSESAQRTYATAIRRRFDSSGEDKRTLLEELDLELGALPDAVREALRLYFNNELARRAFAIQADTGVAEGFEDFVGRHVVFNVYSPGEPVSIGVHRFIVTPAGLEVHHGDAVLYRDTRRNRSATELVQERFPPHLVRELSCRYRELLVDNGTAQIGSGDGMAFTPHQDTSCTLVRQDGVTFLLDASVQSIIRSAYFGVNVYEDDCVALLTHGCHGDHGAGLYFIARVRRSLTKGARLKIYCHRRVLENYIEKCAYVYGAEYGERSLEDVQKEIADLFEYVEPPGVTVTPLNTHSVPTTGFYFDQLNYYLTGDMSGAELLDSKKIPNHELDIRNYYLPCDLRTFEAIIGNVLQGGVLAMESGVPPLHVPRETIVQLVGGEDQFAERVRRKKLFLYHTSGQEDAREWVVL